MSRSIMQAGRECYITGSTVNLHSHHIFGGCGYRKLSEHYGLKVYLRADWHNESPYGVHFNAALNAALKRQGQRAFEQTHTRAEFMRIFGRNYLGDEPEGSGYDPCFTWPPKADETERAAGDHKFGTLPDEELIY